MVSQEEVAMFFREKKSGPRRYLQIVENYWDKGKTRQRVIATLGRLDQLQESGKIDALLASGSRFAQSILVISAHKKGDTTNVSTHRIGGPMVFERLWQETGCRRVVQDLLAHRKFEFAVERVVFTTALHQLFAPGSDRAGEKWRKEYRITGGEELDLHHFYRAMGWLGEELPPDEQDGMIPFSPRCIKDVIEERLFRRRRNLFTSLDVVFFDTTSIYFEGEGGDELVQYGKSKDHRPDRKQMVVGVVLDDEGNPICCEMWPGNTTDVKTLVPVVKRLRKRFRIERVCIVADRGMISQKVIDWLEEEKWFYILGARMRKQKEVKVEVLSRAGRYRVVQPKGKKPKDPSPLKVKEVTLDGRRYIVCFNEDQAKKDAADREAIVQALEKQLKQGDKSLVGNKGYRRYLKTADKGFFIDMKKVKEESRYDGKWVLRTNTDLNDADVALKYKQLLMVEQIFRTMKSILDTRPVFHKCDETIRGHVFCKFLAIVLMKELQNRLETMGHHFEWNDVIRDLDQLEEVEVEQDGKRFLLRSEMRGCCGKVFQAAGVAIPPTVRQL